MKRSWFASLLIVVLSCCILGDSSYAGPHVVAPKRAEVNAQSSDALLRDMPKILSYEQLMRMPKEKRLHYLKGLRVLLTYFEARTANKRDKLVVQRLEEMRRGLVSLLFASDAALAGDEAAVEEVSRLVRHEKPKHRIVATAEDPFANKVLAVSLRCGAVVKGERQWSCDAGEAEPNKKPCTTEQSIKNDTGCGDNEMVVNKKVGTCTLKGAVQDISYCPFGFAGAKVKGERGTYCVPMKAWGELSLARREQLGNLKNPMAPSMEEDFKTTDCARVYMQSNGAALKELQAAEKAAGEAKAAEPTPQAEKCDPIPPECEDREKYRKDFYATKEKRCIFTGNIREYEVTSNKTNRCSAPYEVILAGKAYRCKDKSKIVCNPLLYGTDAGGRAVCVPGRGKATAACAAESERLEKERVGGMPDFLDRDVAGIKSAWDEFRTGFYGLCRGSENIAARFFCEECKEMAIRIKKINALSVDPENCGEVFSSDQYLESMRARRDAGGAPAAD